MYDTILSLPLFKGVSHDQLSEFLLKTNVDFIKYQAGEIFCRPGEECDEVRIIVSGTARLSMQTHSENLLITEICGNGRVLGAERLFGLNTHCRGTGTALEPVSILHFSKEQYIEALQSQRIFLINYLNYLAARAQRASDILQEGNSASLANIIYIWILALTDANAIGYEVNCTPDNLSELTNIPEKELLKQINEMKASGIVTQSGDTIFVSDRHKLHDYITE